MKLIIKFVFAIAGIILAMTGLLGAAYKTGEYRTEIRIWRARYAASRRATKEPSRLGGTQSSPFGNR